ncbi:MAG TPA: immunoglobulin domain-containing protein, partial [Verrucomicrobiota bacterium]|nr:immunoglobulin domain-containing protein [Verrucomicrobiota bacterium]
IPGETNAVLTIPSVTVSDNGDYAVLVSNGLSVIKSRTAKLTVWLHPLIIVQTKTTNVNPGTIVVLNVQATSSTPIHYQWRKNGVDIPGETNQSITIINAQLEQAGTYTVIATDSYGTTESEPADINVLVRPSIIKQLTPSNVVAYVGQDVSFEIGANGLLPISYRFRRNASTVTNIIVRDTNCVFIITNVQFANAGFYDVAITNIAGNASSLSSRAYLTIMTPMTNAIVRPNSNAVFTLNARVTSSATVPSNMALKYCWFFNNTNLLTDSGTNYIIITNATYENEGVYTVIATNSVGTVITQSALLIIREKPTIIRQPSSQVVAVEENAEFSVIAEDAEPLHYRWFFNDVEIPEADAPILTITNVQQTLAGKYFVIVWNDAGSVTSEVATLTIQSGNDSDNDGLPDEWEIANGLNPQLNDASEDKDNDGMTNLAEYIAGTNPNDPTSKLKITSIVLDSDKIVRI